MTAESTRTINRTKVQSLLGLAAGRSGCALNSFLLVLGDRCGLHGTAQYGVDVEGPIVRSKALSLGQKPNSNKAAGGPVHPQGSAIPGEDRVPRVQREETAFMTLVCHECAAATDGHMGTRSPQG